MTMLLTQLLTDHKRVRCSYLVETQTMRKREMAATSIGSPTWRVDGFRNTCSSPRHPPAGPGWAPAADQPIALLTSTTSPTRRARAYQADTLGARPIPAPPASVSKRPVARSSQARAVGRYSSSVVSGRPARGVARVDATGLRFVASPDPRARPRLRAPATRDELQGSDG
jgi:hypothetical protein